MRLIIGFIFAVSAFAACTPGYDPLLGRMTCPPSGGSATNVAGAIVGAGNPNALGTACTATASKPVGFAEDSTTGDIWSCTTYDAYWRLVHVSIGTGPYTISGVSGTVSAGVAGSRPTCTVDALYFATDTLVLSQCSAVTSAWTTLNGSGNVAVVLDTTSGSIRTFDSTGETTQYTAYGATFDGGGSAIATTTAGYTIAKRKCTIVGYDILATGVTGATTFKFWRLASGTTALPTVSDVINTSGLSISSGGQVASTTVSDFTSTAIAEGDKIAVIPTVVSGTTWARVSFRCR